jgi:hypothetical protein
LSLLTVNCLISAPQSLAEVPTHHPEWIEGLWEVASPSGIDGISFEIETSSSGPTGREQFDWQTINIRVYHRQGGKETWGYFATKDKASPQSYSMQDDHSFELFDGEHLRIHFIDGGELQPFDLDITFSPTAHQWSGTWSHAHQISTVVLKRPEPDSGRTPSVFVGDWSGDSSKPYLAPGSLHIRQSADGLLSAWLDRTISGFDPAKRSIHNDQRNGEFLRVYSVTPSGFLLERSGGPSVPSHYSGTLSEDRQVLTGTWPQAGGGGLNAPDRFRKSRVTGEVPHSTRWTIKATGLVWLFFTGAQSSHNCVD